MAWKRELRWIRTVVALAVVAVVLAMVPAGESREVEAGPSGCMGDVCGVSSPCSASDVKVAAITTFGVVDYCTPAPNDTGVYYFLAEFIAGSSTRYDPGIWIATDGGDAKTGACYSDYLTPTLTATYAPPWEPYWDAEDTPGTGDECGDIGGGQTVYRAIGPVTIDCSAANLDGTINTCIGWDNNVDVNCPDTVPPDQSNCPGTGSKCRCEEAPFEVNLNPVDLAIDKTASPAEIPDGGQFDYTLTVSNEMYAGECYTSTGYTIVDDLSIWLKVDGTPPAGCTSVPDPGEMCNQDPVAYGPEGCDGFGDIVTCIVTEDLGCPATAPAITLPMQAWVGAPTVPVTDTRAGGLAPSIDNTACVTGFELDPVSVNNCDSVTAPTAVEISSFTATAGWRSVQLEWETGSEIDGLGFNIYRATSVDGTRIKVNDALIPIKAPGSPFGAAYTFEDTTAKRGWSWDRMRGFVWGSTYYYWLEDVDIHGNSELTGPVEAEFRFWSLFGPFRRIRRTGEAEE
jgi:hypothetical protein